MISPEDRVARLIVRARVLGFDDHGVTALDAFVRHGREPEAVFAVLLAARARRGDDAIGAMVALAFGGADADLDATDRAAVRLALTDPRLLRAFLARLDPAAPGWAGITEVIAAQGIHAGVVLRGMVAHAAAWVALDGAPAAVGAALVTAAEHDLAAVISAALADAGDARELAVNRLVRVMLATRPRPDALLRRLLATLPAGLRGAAVEVLLAADVDTFVGEALALVARRDEPARVDRLVALEVLLRHRPDQVAPFVDEILGDERGDALGLRSRVVLAFGRREPDRFRELALAQARRDPGRWVAELASGWAPGEARVLWEVLLDSGNADLANLAVPALLQIAHAGRAVLARRLLRDPGEVPRETVIAACAALDAEEARSLGELLVEGASEVRLAAVRALAPHAAVAAELLVPHHASERSGRVRAAIVATLGHVPTAKTAGAVQDPERAAMVAHAEATLVALGKKKPAWLSEESVPVPRWRDGHPTPPALGIHLVVTQSRRGGLEPDPEVVAIAQALHAADRKAWAESLLDGWIRADAPAKDHGALLLAALLGGEFASTSLREVIPLWYRGSRRALATTATQLLAMRGSDDALRALDALAATHPHESFGALARAALDDEAATRGLEVEVMLDRCVPTFGLDAQGCAMLDLGQHRVRARWTGGVVMLEDETGGALHALPRAGRRDDPDKVLAARRAWRMLSQELPGVVAREIARLVDAMASARTWSREDFASVLDHPVLGVLARGLWWDLEGRSLRAHEVIAVQGDRDRVRLLHPSVRADVVDLATAPFAQMRRPVVTLSEGAGDAERYLGLAGRTLTARAERHARALSPWARSAWVPETVAEGLCHAFRLRFPCARLDAVLEVDGIALWAESDRRTRVGALRFVRWGEPSLVPLGRVPRPLLSEAVTRAAGMLDDQG